MKNLLSLLVFIVFLTSCMDVEPGHQATIHHPYSSGHDVENVYEPGVHSKAPWNDAFHYDMRQQKYRTQMNDVLDKNGMNVNIDVTVMYHIQNGKSGYLHEAVGPDFEDKLIAPFTHGAAKEVVGKYDAKELYSTKRTALETEMFDKLIEDLTGQYIIIDKVIVTDVDPPQAITAAIEAKEAQKEKNLLAAEKKQQEINLADALREKAKGNADATLIEAEAEAKRIQLLQQQIAKSPLYIDYLETQARLKWDGNLGDNNVFGDNSPILLNRGNK